MALMAKVIFLLTLFRAARMCECFMSRFGNGLIESG